ncbi:MAG: fibronectin type III domain-containing protein, partial [Eubacterium sp.]
GYSDAYASFDERNVTVHQNQQFTLTMTKEGYDAYWNLVSSPCANAQITADTDELAGTTPVAVTDDNGEVTLSFDKEGVYKVSALSSVDGSYIFSPYCQITVTKNAYSAVKEKSAAAADYLLSDTSSLDVNSAVDYLAYLNSGKDMSVYNDGFIDSVKDNLKANDGKLLTSQGKEDIGLYGSVIQIVTKLGYNAENFEGCNLVSALEAIDLTAEYHPYYYRAAIGATTMYDFDSEFVEALCQSLIDEYYVVSKGMNYWGFACDNTAHFITALSPYKDKYADVISDALKLLDGYRVQQGCFYNSEYGTDANSNSTALAMMAYASVGEMQKASSLYKCLTDNFEGEKGAYTYGGDPSLYSTKDAMLSLSYFADGLGEKSTHLSVVTSTAPTCTVKGVTEEKCLLCGEAFSKSEISATGHRSTKYTTRATLTKNGSVVTKCSVCGKTLSSTVIPKASSIKLEATTLTYNGKVRTPRVYIKDSKGKTISSSNYTVTYASGRKNVGKYAVKITFKGNYSGTKTLYFTIKPKATSISSVSAKSKGFTVKWKKQATQTTGYQIQYSTSSKFTSSKYVTASSYKTTSKTISKLKSKKKYYVRIRTYKTVNGTKYFSSWSKAKSVTTKK